MKLTTDEANLLYNYFKSMPYVVLKTEGMLPITIKLDEQKDISDSEYDWYRNVAILLQNGRKIYAVKEIRSKTGHGLREAKAIADLVCKNMSIFNASWRVMYNVDYSEPVPEEDSNIVKGICDEAEKLPDPVV